MKEKAHQPPVKVTFDTSTLSGVVDPDQEVGAADHAAYRAVHAAMKMGQIQGFFSEAVVTQSQGRDLGRRAFRVQDRILWA